MGWSKVRDIWQRLKSVDLPNTVYIVAGGPNGAEKALEIPSTACVIACNSAICMPRHFDYWIAFDHRLVDAPWWETFVLDETICIFGSRLVNRLDMDPHCRRIHPDYYFDYLPNIDVPTKVAPHRKQTPADEMLMHGTLRGGLNVAGVALQFAYWGCAKKVILCGVDQYGTGHWDGETNPDPYELCGEVWPWAKPLGELCKQLAKDGCLVSSLTTTAIPIPRSEL